MKKSLYQIGEYVYWMGELCRVWGIFEDYVFVRNVMAEDTIGLWWYRWNGESAIASAWVKKSQVYRCN